MEKNQIHFCSRCAWTKEMLDKELLKLQDYVNNIPADEKVTDEEYERRLLICDQCKELRGGLCGQCGCYVAVRAARKHGYCPGLKDRWNKM